MADPLVRLDAGSDRTQCLRPVIGIVDDDASVLRALKRLLGASGFTVRTYSSAEEFLAMAHSEHIHCLLLDVHLGGLNGLELHERLLDARVGTPVIFITALDDASTRERAHRTGAIDYLLKPLDEGSLLGAIQAALDRA